MNSLSDDSRRLLESLQDAVAEALERKRRLGQYAVVWRHGAPVFIGPNPPHAGGRYATIDPTDRSVAGVRDQVDNDSGG